MIKWRWKAEKWPADSVIEIERKRMRDLENGGKRGG